MLSTASTVALLSINQSPLTLPTVRIVHTMPEKHKEYLAANILSDGRIVGLYYSSAFLTESN